MAAYEVDLGQVTERRDARTENVFEATVDVYVQEAPGGDGVGDLASADHEVTFDVQDGTATLDAVDAEPAFDKLAFVAARAAAYELDDLQDEYDVEDPVAAVLENE
ncbi:MAG: hypothetical protein ABEH83_10745 [Halobacterium sp.]